MHAPSSADEFFKSNKGSEHIDIFDMITRQPPPFHQHQLNIETPYFEDFATPLVLPPHEVSSDDVESYFSGSVSTVSSIEPLDDEFVPPPQPPRTHTSRKENTIQFHHQHHQILLLLLTYHNLYHQAVLQLHQTAIHLYLLPPRENTPRKSNQYFQMLTNL